MSMYITVLQHLRRERSRLLLLSGKPAPAALQSTAVYVRTPCC